MTVKVGHIGFLNCYPLYYGLQQRGTLRARGIDFVRGVPTDLNRMLLDESIDFGPISSIAYARDHCRLVLSRRLSISSFGAVDSIQLVTRRPLSEVRSVALTSQSATSVTLLKTMLKLRFGRDVDYGPLVGSPADALDSFDAALVIGDEGLTALYFPFADTTCHDLGELWREWTGLPMVYAVWAARQDFARDHRPELLAVEEELVRSMNYGREHLPEVVHSAAGHFRFGVDCLTRYFQVLHYDFPVDYQLGLRRFFELAHEAGELAEVPEFRFLDEVTAVPAGSSPRATRPSDGTGAPRMTDAEALSLLRSRDLLELGRRAHEMRLQKAPGDLATFIVDRNINYTNVCVSGCAFCAFQCAPGSADAYVLPRETILTKIQETIELGGTAVMLQGGLHPELDITYFEALFRAIKERFDITIHSLSPPEIAYIASVSGLSVRETLMRLRAAGLDSLPGGGAEILVDRVREQVAPGKASRDVWLGVMREAHRLGIPGTATMMFGSVETLEERVAHLRAIRDLQDETGGFRAFIPWTFQPGHTQLEGLTEKATGVDYLTTLAVSRLYLDNVANIQASWVTQGLEIGQVALRFGANDLGSTMIEENVVAATGLRVKVNRDDMVRAIRAAGFTPAQRRTDYSLVPHWESAS